MNLPPQRVTITMAECRLLMLGLDLLANRIADTNSGNFPYLIAWDVAGVYKEQEYDVEMSARFIRVRRKLRDMTRSRKIYADACELAALALALRLCRSRKLIQVTDDVSTEIKLLKAKIERYRKRAKRSAIARLGKPEYSSIAGRWRRNVAWLRCNTLCNKPRSHGRPWRTQRWCDQRQQATQAITSVLAENFYEALDDKQMARIVTLLTTTLRRCRHSVGLIDFLRAPQEHTDFLVKFVVKRIELNRLPGAPVSALQAAGDRADKFKEYQESGLGKIALPSGSGSSAIIAVEQEQKMAVPAKAKVPQRYTHHRQALTGEILIDAMAEWLYETVTINFDFTHEVCEQARFQIVNGRIDLYRRKTCATSVKGLIQDLRPVNSSDDAQTVISEYADWMLAVLVAAHPLPIWIYKAIGPIGGRALKREEQARYDGWAAKRLYRSQRDSLGT